MDGDINWIYSVVSLCHTCFVDRCSPARGRSFIITNPTPRPQFMHVGRPHHPLWIHCQHAKELRRRHQGHHGRTQRGTVPLLMNIVPSSHGSAAGEATLLMKGRHRHCRTGHGTGVAAASWERRRLRGRVRDWSEIAEEMDREIGPTCRCIFFFDSRDRKRRV
jgi:hypothetical protein